MTFHSYSTTNRIMVETLAGVAMGVKPSSHEVAWGEIIINVMFVLGYLGPGLKKWTLFYVLCTV